MESDTPRSLEERVANIEKYLDEPEKPVPLQPGDTYLGSTVTLHPPFDFISASSQEMLAAKVGGLAVLFLFAWIAVCWVFVSRKRASRVNVSAKD